MASDGTRSPQARPDDALFAARATECPHVKPWTISWGNALDSKRFCPDCKKFIYAKIDWRGHP